MVVVSIVLSIQLMFFDQSVQLQWTASEDTGGIRRTVDKLNTGQKQAGNIKDKRKEGKDIKYDFIKNFLKLSACTI
jgi:type II secretory pathway component PulF